MCRILTSIQFADSNNSTAKQMENERRLFDYVEYLTLDDQNTLVAFHVSFHEKFPRFYEFQRMFIAALNTRVRMNQ